MSAWGQEPRPGGDGDVSTVPAPAWNLAAVSFVLRTPASRSPSASSSRWTVCPPAGVGDRGERAGKTAQPQEAVARVSTLWSGQNLKNSHAGNTRSLRSQVQQACTRDTHTHDMQSRALRAAAASSPKAARTGARGQGPGAADRVASQGPRSLAASMRPEGQAEPQGVATGVPWGHRPWAFPWPSCPHGSPDSPRAPRSWLLTCHRLQAGGDRAAVRHGRGHAVAADSLGSGRQASPSRSLAISSRFHPHQPDPFLGLSAAFLHFLGFSHFLQLSHEETESQSDRTTLPWSQSGEC